MAYSQQQPTPNWLNAAYYQHVPHSEVNWAALAQQWIAMRSVQDEHVGMLRRPVLPPAPAIPLQPPLPPPDLPVYPPPPMEPCSSFSSRQPIAMSSGPIPPPWRQDTVRFSEPSVMVEWDVPVGPFRAPLPAPVPPAHSNPPPFSAPTPRRIPPQLDFGIINCNNGMTERVGIGGPVDVPRVPLPDAFKEPVYQGNLPSQDMDYRKWRPPVFNQSWMVDDRSASNSPDGPVIDIQQMKSLPAWIREGLEKMEREKQKKSQEQETTAKESSLATRGSPTAKGKFESDSESEGEQESGAEESRRPSRFQSPPLSDEELREQLLLALRKWMTEILVEVTDEEIAESTAAIHRRQLRKGTSAPSRRRRTVLHSVVILDDVMIMKIHMQISHSAQPRMLAQSSALAAITSLGNDQMDSDADESEGRSEGAESESDEQRPEFKVPLAPPVPVSKRKPIVPSGAEERETSGASKPKTASEDHSKAKEKAGQSSRRQRSPDGGRRRRSSSPRTERKKSPRKSRRRSPSPSHRRRSRDRRRTSSRSPSPKRRSHYKSKK